MTYRKDPDEVLDFQVDWTDVLTATDPADTITSSSWTVPAGITMDEDAGILTGLTYKDGGRTLTGRTVHQVWLSGGTVAQTHPVTSRIVTAAGRTHERTIPVFVLNR